MIIKNPLSIVYYAGPDKRKIYGVDGAGQSSPTLTRTDNSVGLTYEVGTSHIRSGFDNCYPWSNIKTVVDASDNVFIKIPKFYSKITKNADGTYKHQLSGVKHNGFTTLFIDGQGNEIDYVLVGKYEASGSSERAYSKSGQNALVNILLPAMRTACKANGAGYQQYDFLIDAILKELFMIEFATTNCQSIMYGYANANSALVSTGRTDSVATASGSPTNNFSGKYACKYRGIENPWGNSWKWVDGINYSAEKIYICTDPNSYASESILAPYIYVADRLITSGYLKEIGYSENFPLLGYEKLISASDASYYCDYYYYGSVGTLLCIGGSIDDGTKCGLWYNAAFKNTTGTPSDFISGRLCYKPLL